MIILSLSLLMPWSEEASTFHEGNDVGHVMSIMFPRATTDWATFGNSIRERDITTNARTVEPSTLL